MKTYRVTGPFAYRGHESGETFSADETDQIKRAVRRGSITEEKAAAPAPKAEPKKEDK